MVIIKYVSNDAMEIHVLIRPTSKTGYFIICSYMNSSYSEATNVHGARQLQELAASTDMITKFINIKWRHHTLSHQLVSLQEI
jgi:hypothetical protein